MPLPELAKCFFAIDQLSAFGLGKTMVDFCGDIGAVVGKPLFVFMEHLNGPGDEFIGGAVGAALHVLLDQRLQLGF